jgi:allantoicase
MTFSSTQLSSMNRAEFIERYGTLFEHSPWVVERAYSALENDSSRNGTPDDDRLMDAFQAVIDRTDKKAQLGLLNAHPELACSRAKHGELTDHSKDEQSLAGLDQCSDDEFNEFSELNQQYQETFGFPFIVAVKGMTRQEILEVFRERVNNSRETEFKEALAQVCRIARFRLTLIGKTRSVGKPDYQNLADPAGGAAIIHVTDDFFGAAKRMLSAHEPEFDPSRYDEHGKWMDGWESRRKRIGGHDYCVMRIRPGVIYGVDIDTSNFTGNYAPAAAIEACHTRHDPDAETEWVSILSQTELQGDSHHYLRIGSREAWSHLRLNIFPDGGIARIRVYGLADDPAALDDSTWVDLACSDHGGTAIACNDMHFGDMSNLLKPEKSANMGDGWETRRRRKPGNDWVVLKLGQAGIIRKVEIDTDFFKGNYPAACSLRGCRIENGDPVRDSANWPVILSKVALGPDQLQVFQKELSNASPVDHVRLDIFPDGGVARLRLLGEPLTEDAGDTES